jgi:hypothetical protein
LRKKSEAEKLQEEASGVTISFIRFVSFIILRESSLLNEQIKNPKQVMIQQKKIMTMNNHQRKKRRKLLEAEVVNVNQLKICRNMMKKKMKMIKHQLPPKLQRKPKVIDHQY